MCPDSWELLTGLDNAVNQLSNVGSGRALLKSGIPTMGNILLATAIQLVFLKMAHGVNYPTGLRIEVLKNQFGSPSHIGSVSTFGGMIILMIHIGIMEKNKI